MAVYKATLLDEAAMGRVLRRIAHEIIEKNGGCKDLAVVGIRRRGVAIAEILAQNIERIEGVPVPVGTLDITCYRDDLAPASRTPVLQESDIPFDLTGKRVVLVDDVLYTGRTVRAALEALPKFGRASSIQLAVLIDRGHRELPIRGDYVGKNVPTSRQERIRVKLPPFDPITAVELHG